MTIAMPTTKPPKQEGFSSDASKLFPHQGPWTEAEYLALDTNRLVELSDGELRVIEMATQSHQNISGFFYNALLRFVNKRKLGKVNYAPLPVKLRHRKYREPDVQFMFAQHSDRRFEQYWDGADLVMEVVSQDRKHDLDTKKAEYATSGIPEYWVVDPLLQEVTVLKLARKTYETGGVYHPGDKAASVLLPGFVVNVTALLAAK